MTTNPIKDVRLKHRGTLDTFAAACDIHPQALYLNEQGVYPKILPKVVKYLQELGEWDTLLELKYKQFVAEKRKVAGDLNSLSEVDLGEPIFDIGHPFVVFREKLPGVLSRMAFCKDFCVQPSLMYRLETSGTKHLPEQLREALTESGLPAIVLQELADRCQEYVEGEYAFADAS